jgi:outer membrane protein assembly factor BamB
MPSADPAEPLPEFCKAFAETRRTKLSACWGHFDKTDEARDAVLFSSGSTALVVHSPGFIQAEVEALTKSGELRDHGYQDELALIDLRTGKVLSKYKGKSDGVFLALSPDGLSAVRAGKKGFVRTIFASNGNCEDQVYGEGAKPGPCYLTDNGKHLIGGQTELHVWELLYGEEQQHFELGTKPITAITPGTSRNEFVTGSGDALVFWDPSLGEKARLGRGQGEGVPKSLALTADGMRLFEGTSTGLLRCWDLSTGHEAWRQNVQGGACSQVTIVENLKEVLVAEGNGSVVLRSAETGEELDRIPLSSDPHDSIMVVSMRAGRDGTFFVGTSRGSILRFKHKQP